MINLHSINDTKMKIAQLWFNGRKVLRIDGTIPTVEDHRGSNTYTPLTWWREEEWSAIEKSLRKAGRL